MLDFYFIYYYFVIYFNATQWKTIQNHNLCKPQKKNNKNGKLFLSHKLIDVRFFNNFIFVYTKKYSNIHNSQKHVSFVWNMTNFMVLLSLDLFDILKTHGWTIFEITIIILFVVMMSKGGPCPNMKFFFQCENNNSENWTVFTTKFVVKRWKI